MKGRLTLLLMPCLALASVDAIGAAQTVGVAGPQLETIFPHASGIFLAEVTGITRRDGRAGDGDLYDDIVLSPVRGTGTTLPSLYLVVAPGGFTYDDFLRLSGIPVPERRPSFSIRPDYLQARRRYWFVTASAQSYDAYPQHVMRCWQEDSVGSMRQLLEQAVETNAYQWHPEHWPKEQRTIGWMHHDDDSSSSIRMWRSDRLLWERRLSGTLLPQAYPPLSLLAVRNLGHLRPPGISGAKVVLLTESRIRLDPENEFHLPAGPWMLQRFLDADNGDVLVTRVKRPGRGDTEVLYRAYDTRSGRVRYERIEDIFRKGGRAVGAVGDFWLRRIERRFDPKSGRLSHEETFRSDDHNEWIPVDRERAMRAGPAGVTALQ